MDIFRNNGIDYILAGDFRDLHGHLLYRLEIDISSPLLLASLANALDALKGRSNPYFSDGVHTQELMEPLDILNPFSLYDSTALAYNAVDNVQYPRRT